jgi:transposase
LSLRSDDLNSIGELYTENEFRQLVVAIGATPAFFSGLGELEDHGERSLVRETSLGAHRAVAHRRERAFDDVRRAHPAQRQAPAAERLAEMLAVRRQLSAEKVAAETASRLLEDGMLQRLSRRRIGRLAAEIDLLDQRMVEIVATDAALDRRYRLLSSMPGVGPVLACTLIALLPELGRMSRKQVAALVAVAPYAFESGTLKGRRYIWRGRAHVRQVLYKAAMSASNWNPALKAFHDRLKAAGKLPKVAIVAVMRKMITTLNAMVRDDVVWADRLIGRHSLPTPR